MLTSAISSISGLFDHQQDQNGFQSLNNQTLIKTINTLSTLFPKSDAFTIKLPKIVCVGSQSSGKSSLMSGLIGMNLLPTGKEMVTRCPLNLQLIHHDIPRAWATIGTLKINLTLPDPTHDEIYSIQEQIKKITNKHAGDNKNISHTEIVLTIHSPNVPDLTLIDLPGLTLIPCTDKGQPKDIKMQIRNLISSYIKDEDSIILAVMPARADLETDMALELAKEHDPTGARTCGILTKIDLMNKGNNVQNYLSGDVSVDLRLGYGYFAVNNVNHTSMHESLQQETQYFRQHPVYKERVGRMMVGKHLSTILVDRIRANTPKIVEAIASHERTIVHEMNRLGSSLLTNSKEENMTHVHMFLSTFAKNMTTALTESGGRNYGKHLKNHFVTYRNAIRVISYTFEESYLNEMIQNCNGNHMSVSMFSIDVLEGCLQDESLDTFGRFMTPSATLVSEISGTIRSLMGELLTSSELNRFHSLKECITQGASEFLGSLNDAMVHKIQDLVQSEKSYIWTDDVTFNQKLSAMSGSSQSQPAVMNQLINTYMNTVKNTMSDRVPKMIMCFVVKAFTSRLFPVLFERIRGGDISKLLSEKPEIEQSRTRLVSQNAKIQTAKQIMKMK